MPGGSATMNVSFTPTTAGKRFRKHQYHKQRSEHSDSDCCAHWNWNLFSGSANDHDAASEPDSDGRTDGDVHGGGGRDGAAELPVAEERSEHRGGDGEQLHDASDGDDG